MAPTSVFAGVNSLNIGEHLLPHSFGHSDSLYSLNYEASGDVKYDWLGKFLCNLNSSLQVASKCNFEEEWEAILVSCPSCIFNSVCTESKTNILLPFWFLHLLLNLLQNQEGNYFSF